MASISLQQIITITKVASIAIEAIIETYRFIDSNKDKYREFFITVLNFMDSMEIPNSPLTGLQKREAVLTKVKELAVDNRFDWDIIKEAVIALINDAKKIFNQMLDARDSILSTLKHYPM